MEEVRGALGVGDGGDEGDLLYSAPRTAFNEIFGLLVAICHGDEGGPSVLFLSIEGVGLANRCCSACCCCCFLRSRCDSLLRRLPGAMSVRCARRERPADILDTRLEDACAMISFMSNLEGASADEPQGFAFPKGSGGFCRTATSSSPDLDHRLCDAGIEFSALVANALPFESIRGSSAGKPEEDAGSWSSRGFPRGSRDGVPGPVLSASESSPTSMSNIRSAAEFLGLSKGLRRGD